jgi:ankyrin repeat protein
MRKYLLAKLKIFVMILRALSSVNIPVVSGNTKIGDDLNPIIRSDWITRTSKGLFPSMNLGTILRRMVLCDTIESSLGPPTQGTGHDEVFFSSVRAGKTSEVRKALKHGTNLKQTDEESWTCLHWAVEMGHLSMVTMLLDAEPLLLNMKTKEGLSAINIATWRGDKRMVELLINQGAEIDDKTKWGETPLHHAVTFGHWEVCQLLLNHGADPFAEDRLSRTPHQIAMQKGSKRVKDVLSKYTSELSRQ